MKNICTVLIISMVLCWVTGCSVLISTPPVARIQIYGADNTINEYVVVLDSDQSESTLDIPITDRYAINLDFQWLLGSEYIDQSNTDVDLDQLPQEVPVTPWMMCTFRF